MKSDLIGQSGLVFFLARQFLDLDLIINHQTLRDEEHNILAGSAQHRSLHLGVLQAVNIKPEDQQCTWEYLKRYTSRPTIYLGILEAVRIKIKDQQLTLEYLRRYKPRLRTKGLRWST